jgi:hypothetical protein
MMIQFKIQNLKFKIILVFVVAVLLQSCAAAKAKKCQCPTFGTNKKTLMFNFCFLHKRQLRLQIIRRNEPVIFFRYPIFQ